MKQQIKAYQLFLIGITLLTTMSTLNGCGDTDLSELHQFIEQERKNAQATNIDIKLYIRPKQFIYRGFNHRNPFIPYQQVTTTTIINNLRTSQTATSSNLCEKQIPFFQHRLERLNIDIETVKLHGFYRQGQSLYGLLIDVTATVFRVMEGDIILSGQDNALVTKVTEGKVSLQYYHQETVDCWVKQLIVIES